MTQTTLVLGGARSGKSVYAESLTGDGPALYIASAQAFDAEMESRIRLHAERRGPRWTAIEEPLDIAGAIGRNMQPDRPILVDCLTLWISNLMFADKDVARETEILADVLSNPVGPVILVSNEVGMGLVPETKLGRDFRDHQGRVNQRMAQICRRVAFVAAGLPLILKDIP